MFHLAQADATDLTCRPATGIHTWGRTRSNPQDTYIHKCTVHKSIESCEFQLGRSWERLSFLFPRVRRPEEEAAVAAEAAAADSGEAEEREEGVFTPPHRAIPPPSASIFALSLPSILCFLH
jgi:hypothetical protein